MCCVKAICSANIETDSAIRKYLSIRLRNNWHLLPPKLCVDCWSTIACEHNVTFRRIKPKPLHRETHTDINRKFIFYLHFGGSDASVSFFSFKFTLSQQWISNINSNRFSHGSDAFHSVKLLLDELTKPFNYICICIYSIQLTNVNCFDLFCPAPELMASNRSIQMLFSGTRDKDGPEKKFEFYLHLCGCEPYRKNRFSTKRRKTVERRPAVFERFYLVCVCVMWIFFFFVHLQPKNWEFALKFTVAEAQKLDFGVCKYLLFESIASLVCPSPISLGTII